MGVRFGKVTLNGTHEVFRSYFAIDCENCCCCCFFLTVNSKSNRRDPVGELS